ncbi:MAG: hypothetical protein LC745_06240, partial [Planctomycetia bacterium]|nr:hypothetical protein [Planctomycetia bacterium]
FSGTLCVDELHLGRFTLLLATDPVSDLPVAFALDGANDQDHMRRFLEKVRYKWRGRRTLVRFVVLTLDEIWRGWATAKPETNEGPDRARCVASQSQPAQQSSCAA